MFGIFTLLLYQPLYNILVFLIGIVPFHDLGIAIVILTIGIKLLIYPLQSQQIKAQKALQDVQPDLLKLKEKHKDNKEAHARATMDFYKKNKINPLSSCFPLLIQIVIFIALYQVFINGLKEIDSNLLYPFIEKPENISHLFFGLVDLSKSNLIFALIAAIFQFYQSKMFFKKNPQLKTQPKQKEGIGEMMQMMNKQMLYLFPLMTFFVAIKVPSGLALYWIISTLFTIIQQYIIIKKPKNTLKS